jgi:hypothetical protein
MADDCGQISFIKNLFFCEYLDCDDEATEFFETNLRKIQSEDGGKDGPSPEPSQVLEPELEPEPIEEVAQELEQFDLQEFESQSLALIEFDLCSIADYFPALSSIKKSPISFMGSIADSGIKVDFLQIPKVEPINSMVQEKIEPASPEKFVICGEIEFQTFKKKESRSLTKASSKKSSQKLVEFNNQFYKDKLDS